jgi:hypothetical protein
MVLFSMLRIARLRGVTALVAGVGCAVLSPQAKAQFYGAMPQQHSYSNTTGIQESSTKGHQSDTNPGRPPRVPWGPGQVCLDCAEEHAVLSPDKLSSDGPSLPKVIDMNGFTVQGLVGPNWPVVVDFAVGGAGAAHLDIVTKKRIYEVTIPNEPNHRGYAILRLPKDFVDKPETAIFQVQAIAPVGSAKNTAVPQMRVYGLGAGEKAVGSVAIDQLQFKPGSVHTTESAMYSFHAHSSFNGVRAEFVLTELRNGHVVVEKDQEVKLPPVPQDESPRQTWVAKGKTGEHMLEIRAWRGLENGGDWVVAWSPDIVDVLQ